MSANETIRVAILSDVVCPWCVIGYQRLRRAAEHLGMADSLEVTWHPFELNPDMPAEGQNLREHLHHKYGTTLSGSIAARQRLTALGESVGFTFNYFDAMRMVNTRKAHLLMQWSLKHGRQNALAEALFAAYFSHGQDLSDTERLLAIVTDLGLNREAAQAVLTDPTAEQQLLTDQHHWLAQGFRGVPAMVFDGQHVLTGAQEIQTYEAVLSRHVQTA